MSLRRMHMLRRFSPDEEQELTHMSQSSSSPAASVRCVKLLLLVQGGLEYLAAARQVGQRNGDGVSAGRPV